jgi:phosphate transport system permease protein
MLETITTSVREAVLGADATDGSELIVGAAGALLVGTVLSFVVMPALALPVLLGFAVVTAVSWSSYQAEIARLLTLVATVLTVLTVFFITAYLFLTAYPVTLEFDTTLFTVPVTDNGDPRWFFWLEGLLPNGEPGSSEVWNPRAGAYSLIPMIWATVIVTVLAMLIAGPLGLFGALFIAEVASDGLREVVKPGIEILAGIPSIVYGFIGFQVLNGFIQDSFIDDGASFLIAGTVVGIMALPTVVSVAEDALSSVPNSMRDGAMAMGATDWQTMKSISVPAAFSGISAAIILGVGRAIGETMAVAAIMDGGVGLASPLFDMFDASATLTSIIAVTYGSAGETTVDVLFVAGVMLFTIVAGASVLAQYIERRMRRNLMGETE